MRVIVGILLCCLTLTSFAEAKVSLTSLKIQREMNRTKLIFNLSQKTFGKVKWLAHTKQLIVEFAQTQNHAAIPLQKTWQNFPINEMKLRTENNFLRIYFNMKENIRWETHFFSNHETGEARLEVSIVTFQKKRLIKAAPKITTADELTHLLTDRALIPKKKMTHQPNSFISARKVKPRRIFTIVIDAGHGGKDPGAIGKKGTEEKQVVLRIAKKLAVEVNRHPGVRVFLTREGDYFVPLRTRLNVARQKNADLFIAIHADAYFHTHARGASVYALSQRGATSEAARWLAQRDNFSELDGVELDALKDRSLHLRSLLIDLAQTASIQDSIRLGNKVLDALDQVSSLHHTHVEQAPFVVLKSPDIPSILVEIGFISNLYEEERLRSDAYQTKIAQAIWQGIDSYIKTHPI